MKKSMRLILDANEYIFGMGKVIEKPHSTALFPAIRMVMKEVSEFPKMIKTKGGSDTNVSENCNSKDA